MKIRSKLRRSYYGARRDPGLPAWSSLIASGGIILLIAYLAWGVVSGTDSDAEIAAREERTGAIEDRLELSEADMLALQEQFGSDVVQREDADTTTPDPAATDPAATATTVPAATTVTPAPPAEPAATTPAATTPADPATLDPAATTPPAVDTAVPAGPTPALVPLPGPGGTTVNVDQQALDVARAATVALFTGDFSAVAIAPGVELPTLTRTYPDPLVSAPTVRSVGDESVTITFSVDPDGPGAAGLRLINTTVTAGTGGWSWAGI